MKQFWLLVLSLVTLVGCQTAVPEDPRRVADWDPTPGAAVPTGIPPTAVPTPTAWPMPTLEPFARTILTETVVPTREPAPTPPPPANQLQDEASGFTMTFPSNWVIEESLTDAFAVAHDEFFDLWLNVYTDFSEEGGYETFFEGFSEGIALTTNGATLTLVEEDSVPFGTDGTAQIATYAVSGAEVNTRLNLWLGYAERSGRSYIFVVYASPEAIQQRRHTLQAILAQVRFEPATLYGLNRAETLVLPSGDPLSESLDPARTGGSAAGYVGLLYRGLVRLTPELQVVPDLAETWVVSDDGLVYTFTLREGLTFGLGNPLTAEDVLFSWERAADPATESTMAATYLGDILGVKEKVAGEAETIAGLRVLDERTIEVTLDAPKPYFLVKLTYPTSYIIDSTSIKGSDDSWVFQPNPSGPYTIEEYRETEVLILKRNDNYHTPAGIQHIVYLMARVGTPLSLFEAGEFDIVYIGSEDVQAVSLPSHPLNENLVSGTSLCTGFVQMSNSLPPFDDVNVRRAFALALDKEAFNDLNSDGLDLVAQTILPPAMPGYSAELAAEQATNMGYNPEAARAALAASAYADNLPPIRLLAAGFGDSERDDLNALVANWFDVLGVEVTIEFIDPINFQAALAEAEGHMVSYGWCADYPDPENFLDILYGTGNSFNVAGYSNPELDELLAQGRVELDVATRVAIYQQAERLLLADVAAVPYVHSLTNVLVSDKIEGYVEAPIGVPIMDLLRLRPVTEEGQ